VYGAQRPGYPAQAIDATPVSAWISFMQRNGVYRVCCLLALKQLAYYRLDLLGTYREVFGESNVCHAAIEDYHLCDAVKLEDDILPFLLQSNQARIPVVVHGSGGSGRTGHVLAAWLVRHRGLSVDDALAAVVSTGRCLRATASKPLTT
jgi:protein-tyrosine phosphatase